MDLQGSSELNDDNRPSPADFELYLPWACKQLQLDSDVQVQKIYQNEYVSVIATERTKKGKSRTKLTPSRLDVNYEREKEEPSASAIEQQQAAEKPPTKIIRIQAMYNSLEKLVQIKFHKNTQLPRTILKIISLILQFHNSLHTITIQGGIDIYTVYEICKFLPTSHITDICFDGCYSNATNYYLLLDQVNNLKHLSLSRCKIDDLTIESLSSKLVYPLPASKSLSILNLSSNRITDEGAKFLANALCSNRQLSYLNLACNMITDKGAFAILDTFMEFRLTPDVVLEAKTRLMKYLKTKNEMIASTIRDLRLEEVDKRVKRKASRPAPLSAKKVKGDSSQKSLIDPFVKNVADLDSALQERAVLIVESALGNFIDPFSRTNIVITNGDTYCKGNNTLVYLNFSYNYLSYLSLKKLQAVLVYQQLAERKPRGLMNVLVEGNNLPIACKELTQIENILDVNLTVYSRRYSSVRKRTPSKVGTPR